MSNRFDFGGVNLGTGGSEGASRPTSETPFCIAVLGDFSGRASRGLFEPNTVGNRRALLVDRDNFDEVMSKFQVELHLATETKVPLVFRFAELEDFHPDRLFEHEALQELNGLRNKLQDPASFSRVAAEFGLLRTQAPAVAPKVEASTRAVAPNPVRLASGSLLDEMVEQTEARIALEPVRRADEISDFARQLAAKYAVSAPDPRQAEVVTAVDHAIGDGMRAILHHPDFQALEAIWRATFLLVRQIETSPQLKICLVDISKQELAADLSASDSVRGTGTFRVLVEKAVGTPGADPWTVVVGAYDFGVGGEDIALLSKLSRIARDAGAVWLAGANSSILGCKSLSQSPHPREWKEQAGQNAWNQLRRQPEAASVGLALPRFLLRLPYGGETSPLESFDFEEFSGSQSHEDYLWGNPAFALALLLAQSFSDAGWDMRPGGSAQIGSLPLHTYRADGISESKPCAEVLLTDEGVERILEEGLIPLISYKGRDAVRVGRFQSIAEPQKPLRGRWSAEN